MNHISALSCKIYTSWGQQTFNKLLDHLLQRPVLGIGQ